MLLRANGEVVELGTAQGLVGWRFGAKRNSGVYIGYRYRDMSYSKAEFEVEKTLSGPGLGVKIGF